VTPGSRTHLAPGAPFAWPGGVRHPHHRAISSPPRRVTKGSPPGGPQGGRKPYPAVDSDASEADSDAPPGSAGDARKQADPSHATGPRAHRTPRPGRPAPRSTLRHGHADRRIPRAGHGPAAVAERDRRPALRVPYRRLRAASCGARRVRDGTQIRQIWVPRSWHQAFAFRPNANRHARFANFLAHRD